MPATIHLGSTGEDVRRLQRVLARSLLWSPFGPITGVFDAGLENAVKAFQQGNDLPPDGIVGPATWDKLPCYRERSPVLRYGSTGPVVAWLQRVLAGGAVVPEFTPYSGLIDGIYGPVTETSVRALQNWANSPVDGVVGDNTWFIWLTPGTTQKLTLEGACGLLKDLL